MFDIASGIDGLKARWDRAVAHRQRIDREKLMIDPSSIVLKDEFFGLAVDTVVHDQSSFQAVFGNGSGIDNCLEAWSQTDDIPVFWLKADQVSEWAQENLRRHITTTIENEIEPLDGQSLDTTAFFSNIGAKECCEDIVERSKQQTIDYMIEQSRVPALFLGHVVHAMDAHKNVWGTSGVERYERCALMRDEGQHAVNFWHAVNNLKDYSGFFPDKPKPKGDKENRGGALIGVGGWQPA